MRRILIATDGSPCATAAIAEGLELAEELAADVTFVSVRTPASAIWGAPIYQAQLDSATKIARDAIDGAVALAEERGIEAEYEIVEAPVSDAIMNIAETHDADLIVVGSRGRGAVTGALFGSVSKALVTRSDRPVLIVKERKHGAVPA